MPFRLTNDAVGRSTGMCIEYGWGLGVTCEACRRAVRLPQTRLAAMSPETLLAEICARLVCSGCGGRDGVVGLNNANWHAGMIGGAA